MTLRLLSLLLLLSALMLLCRPYLEARRPFGSLALILGIALGPGGADLIPLGVVGGLGPLMALAAGWLALLAAESCDLTTLRRIPAHRRLVLLLIPPVVLGAIGWLAGNTFVFPLACIALALDPDAVRHALSLTPRPEVAARFAPAIASVALGLALLLGAHASLPQVVLLGIVLGLFYILTLRIAEGKGVLLSLLLSVPVLGWGISASFGIPALAVVFVSGVVLAHESAKRDLIFTLLREHERSLTFVLLVMTGASLRYGREIAFDGIFWFLTAAMALARPLAWGLTRATGLSASQSLPMSPLVLPLAMLAYSWPDWTSGATGTLPLSVGVAFVMSETAWILLQRSSFAPRRRTGSPDWQPS